MEKIKINKENNETLLKFNNEFYDENAVQQAVSDFKEYCNISIEDNEITIKPKETSDLNIIGYEFYNYVLGLMKNM